MICSEWGEINSEFRIEITSLCLQYYCSFSRDTSLYWKAQYSEPLILHHVITCNLGTLCFVPNHCHFLLHEKSVIGQFFLQIMIFVVSFLPLFVFFHFCLTKEVTVMAEYLANEKILKPLFAIESSFELLLLNMNMTLTAANITSL